MKSYYGNGMNESKNEQPQTDQNVNKNSTKDHKEISKDSMMFKQPQPEQKIMEQEQQSVITYQNSRKNTGESNGLRDIKDNVGEESKRLWQNNEHGLPKNGDNQEKIVGDQQKSEIITGSYEPQYSKESDRIFKEEEFGTKDRSPDKSQRKTSHRESAIQMLHRNDGSEEKDTKVIHTNNQFLQNKQNSYPQFLVPKHLLEICVKEENPEPEDFREDVGKSYSNSKVINHLPDFQHSYGRPAYGDTQRRKLPLRFAENSEMDTKKIIKVEKNQRMINLSDQNRSTTHHPSDIETYDIQIQNIDNVEQIRLYSERQEGAEYQPMGEIRFMTQEKESNKVSQPRNSVMMHAERDPMLGDSYTAPQKGGSFLIDYAKPAGPTENVVKYEEHTEQLADRPEVERQTQIMVKSNNQLIQSESLPTTLIETGTGTYTTLQTVPHPPSNAYNNLYPSNEYHDNYIQKPANPDMYEIARGGEPIYEKPTGNCYRNKPHLNHRFSQKVEGSVIGYPGSYISEGGQRLQTITSSHEVPTEFVIENDTSSSVLGINKISGK